MSLFPVLIASFRFFKYSLLKLNFGLKHGLLLRPKEPEIIAVMEVVWNQISRQDILKDNHISKSRVQTALRAFTYNYLEIESRDYELDQKKIRVIRNLKERFAILKPDKGQGVVLLSKDTYTNTVERIFKDKTKFKMLKHDPTLINLENYTKLLKDIVKTKRNNGRGRETDASKIRSYRSYT